MRALPALLIFAVSIVVLGCEKSPDAVPEAVESTPDRERVGSDGDEAHDEEHFHLGGKMYEISRRFSAVWFAGQSGNAAMVKYQTHELEEVIEEIAEAKPMEEGVDVSARLKSDVEAHFEDLEKQAEAKDKKAFEATYRKVMNNCTVCHADTKHGFIQVKVPDYNPYPNIAY